MPRSRQVSEKEFEEVKALCEAETSKNSNTGRSNGSQSADRRTAQPAADGRLISLLDLTDSSSSSDEECNDSHHAPQQHQRQQLRDSNQKDRHNEKRRASSQDQGKRSRSSTTTTARPKISQNLTVNKGKTSTKSRSSSSNGRSTMSRMSGRLSTEAIARERTCSASSAASVSAAPSTAAQKQLAKLTKIRAESSGDSDQQTAPHSAQNEHEAAGKEDATLLPRKESIVEKDNDNDEKSSTLSSASKPATSSLFSAMGNAVSGWLGRSTTSPAVDEIANENTDTDTDTTGVIPEKLEERVKNCWVCNVDFEVGDGEHALYTRHAHPLLATTDTASASGEEGDEDDQQPTVPVCSECAPRIVNRDVKLTSNSDDEDNSTSESSEFCSMCLASDSEMVFCCDECPRQVCLECVATCHGGGKSGLNKAREIGASDDSWVCTLCKPPNALKKLGAVISSETRTPEETIELLGLVEECQKEAVESLERDEDMRNSIRLELEAEGKDSSSEAVDDEFNTWREQVTMHSNRLYDTISHLQEELSQVHGLRLAEVYEQILGQRKPQIDDENDAEWVQEANKEILLREMEESKKRLSPLHMPDECFEDVEDLKTDELSIDGLQPKAQGYASVSSRAHPNDIKKAEEEEDRILHEKALTVVVVTEKKDQQSQKQQQVRASRAGANEYANLIRPRKKRKSSVGSHSSKARPAEKDTALAAVTNPMPSAKAPRASFSKPSWLTNEMPHGTSTAKAAPSTPTKVLPQNTTGDVAPSKAPTAPNMGPPRPMTSNSTPSRQMVADAKKQAALELVPRPRGHPNQEAFVNSTVMMPGSDVCVARELAEKLKVQQIDAVQFMWSRAFADCMEEKSEVCGCILAHSMGLGKTLSAIALMHSVYVHELVKTVLLLVPVNTVENWKNEFNKWVGHLRPHLDPLCLGDVSGKKHKEQMVDRWESRGGILLAPPSQLKSHPELASKCDLLVIDEAHTLLKNTGTKTYSYLKQVRTKRRIALTGTPLQNNLMEYYGMIDFLVPNLLGSKADFEREFEQPIVAGLTTDCSAAAEQQSGQLTAVLHEKLAPYIQRRDASVLASDLPPMQSVVLYTRPSKLQTTLYRSHKRHQAINGSKNFFEAFAALKPINNHPGSLLHKRQGSSKRRSSGEDDEEAPDSSSIRWWDEILSKHGSEKLAKAEHGFKIILLLHILVKAEELGEKVIIFSQCLSTLNFVERVLQSKCWADHSQSLAELLGKTNYGGWRKGLEYLRIDGSTSGADRGTHIENFERNYSTRAFLLSSVAGGIGINLYAASRVVLLDTHFNPAISEQAIFRAYRYGQTKPVFVYRLLTEASMEEKVYARALTKSGLAMRVIDKKNINKYFSAKDLADLQTQLTWVQCDKCEKWRVLPELDEDKLQDLPEKWYCSMNSDPKNCKCSDPERDALWYELQNTISGEAEGGVLATESAPATQQPAEGHAMTKEQKKQLEKRDPLLQHLLKLKQDEKTSKMISKHAFHELIAQKEELAGPPTPASSRKRPKASSLKPSPASVKGSLKRSPAQSPAKSAAGKSHHTDDDTSTVGSHSTGATRRSKRDRHKTSRYVEESSSDFKSNSARTRKARSLFSTSSGTSAASEKKKKPSGFIKGLFNRKKRKTTQDSKSEGSNAKKKQKVTEVIEIDD